MNHRRLGNSGLVVSEVSYDSWITHESQATKDTSSDCLRAVPV
jgi:hypothetical protein